MSSFFYGKNKFKNIITKIIVIFLCVISFSLSVINPISLEKEPIISCSAMTTNSYIQNNNFPSIKEIINKLFKKDSNNKNVEQKEKVYVYLGGYPLGFTINCKGVVVVALSNEIKTDLKEGDIITKIEDFEITNVTDILNIINSDKYKGKSVSVEYIRDDKVFLTTITPVFDNVQNFYKLGLWVRDNAAGVGTLTYIRKDNFRFGALGHPVCDIDTGSLLPAKGGNIFKCNIVGYKKGIKGSAGELKGLFLRNTSILGNLDLNNEFGVYGTFDKDFIDNYNLELYEVASQSEVTSGKAYIRCTIDGLVPKDYEIEIVKTYFQSSKSNKSMFIRVKDENLLKTTGGIVQGMSGIPIIQNGKFVGEVTHVFFSDPTKGY